MQEQVETNVKTNTDGLAKSHALRADFQYLHRNPYHDKLGKYSDFVLRDEESEKFVGKWQTDIFQNDFPVHVEIGSGYGHFIREYCQDHPEVNFIGIDFRFKRAFDLAKKLDLLNLKNIRYLRAKGERIQFMFEENEVDAMYLFFPDPWPKKRHNKKRIFQQPLLDAAYKVLKPGGKFYIKTDHDEYALWMISVFEQDPRFDIEFEAGDLRVEHPQHFLAKYTTKFEKIFTKQGVNIKGFVLSPRK